VIGLTVKLLDIPTPDMAAKGITHAIGSDKFPAPQGTLMATLIRGMLSFNLDWKFVLAGVFLAITMELSGVNALNFAVGAYLPISTTLPIFAGGVIKRMVDHRAKRRGETIESGELGRGSLFATGLVAGGTLAGVIVALLSIPESMNSALQKIDFEKAVSRITGDAGYQLLGAVIFCVMGWTLYRVATKKSTSI